uniref:Retrotransposon gag domain-containing protein n=1 Tax=Populus alba TaxID=43335 RepID=A0A4U5PT15_POPAL|nr:hypothetical protein D5086_0000181890 [Populus alba]
MEHYFSAAKVELDEQVNIAVMYLTGDAKLWWQRRSKKNLNAGRPKMKTWETLKCKLREQFLPNNTSWIAREDLKKLWQDRQKVLDLSLTIVAANGLADLIAGASEGTAGASSVSYPPMDRYEMKRTKKGLGGGEPKQADGNGKLEAKGKEKVSKSSSGCFICDGKYELTNPTLPHSSSYQLQHRRSLPPYPIYTVISLPEMEGDVPLYSIADSNLDLEFMMDSEINRILGDGSRAAGTTGGTQNPNKAVFNCGRGNRYCVPGPDGKPLCRDLRKRDC